jgi:hypothetical protein
MHPREFIVLAKLKYIFECNYLLDRRLTIFELVFFQDNFARLSIFPYIDIEDHSPL